MSIVVDNFEQALGGRIAAVRLERNMTQRHLAELAGISLGTLIRLEQGKGSSVETLYRVFDALGLKDRLDDLLAERSIQPVLAVSSAAKRQRIGRTVMQANSSLAATAVRKRARPKKDASGDETQPWRWG
ncbi:MAG: hypothetical protein RLZZ444_3263, partial [Pseudomonadota bacterium]